MAIVSEWVASLTSAAKAGVPLVFSVKGRTNRVIIVRGYVGEVGVNHVTVIAAHRPRFVAAFGDLLAVTRSDGRPWTARRSSGDAPDPRADVAAASERHLDQGGLE